MSDHPIVELDFIERASRLKLSPFLTLCPSLWELEGTSILFTAKAEGGLDHDTGRFSPPHVLDSPPETHRHFGISQSHLERLLFVKEDFTLLDLIVTVNLAVCADAWSATAFRLVTIVLESFPLAHLAVITDDIDFDPTDVFVKHRLLLLFFWLFRLFSILGVTLFVLLILVRISFRSGCSINLDCWLLLFSVRV